LLGHALCGARRTIDGIAQLRRTAARRPPYLPAFQELAGQLSRNGQLDEAVKVIEDALSLSPASVDLMLDVGRLSLQNNDRTRARAVLGAARHAAPARLDVLMELGKATLLDGEYAEAAEIYRLVLVQRPDDITSRANRAICLMEMGNRHCGESALRKVLHARPQMLGRAAFALASTPHGRFFFRPTAAAEFLERKPA
jgi:Flp pilus assembly protein TadD